MADERIGASLVPPIEKVDILAPRQGGRSVGLAARFEQFYPVVIGTTLGMMLANIPVVVIGDRIAGRLPVKAIRLVAAAVFAALGVLTIAGIGE